MRKFRERTVRVQQDKSSESESGGTAARETRFALAWFAGLLLAFVLPLLTLSMGHFQEDYGHLRNATLSASILDMFGTYRVLGGFWFNFDTLHVRFLRPITEALLYFDFRSFGTQPWPYHLHTLGWYLLWMMTVALFFRRTLGKTSARPATLVALLSAIPFLPVAVVSTRYALLTALFAAWGILAHIDWRNRRSKVPLAISVLCYAAALLSAETALGMIGYVVAFEFLRKPRQAMLTRRGFLRALTGCVPIATVYLLYLAFYVSQGYGGDGSDMYLYPPDAPLDYLLALPGRFLLAAGTFLTAFSYEIVVIAEETSQSVLDRLLLLIQCAGCLVLATFLFGLHRIWPQVHPHRRAALRWLIGGALISAFALTPNLPMARMLMLPLLGFAAAAGTLLERLWRRFAKGAAHPVDRVLLVSLVAVLFVFHPVVWIVQVYQLESNFSGNRTVALDAPFDDPAESVFILCADKKVEVMTVPLVRAAFDKPVPATFHLLSLSPGPCEFTTTSPASFELTTLNGTFLDGFLARIWWSQRHPFHVNDTKTFDGWTATILQVDDGRPRKVAFRMPEGLTRKGVRWVTYCDDVWTDVEPPPIGQSIVLCGP